MDGKPSTSALKALSSHASQDTSRQRDRFGGGPSAQPGGSVRPSALPPLPFYDRQSP